MVEEAVLMNDFIELVGSDLVMETLNKLNPFAKEDPTTQLSCALVRFTAEDGIRDCLLSRGLGDVYKRQLLLQSLAKFRRQESWPVPIESYPVLIN